MQGLGDEIYGRPRHLIKIHQLGQRSTKLRKFRPKTYSLHIKKSVNPISNFRLERSKHKDQGKDQGRFHQKRPSVSPLGDSLSNVFNDEDIDSQDQPRYRGIEDSSPDEEMDVEQPVFNECDSKEKTDQDRVEAGKKEDGPAQFEKIIGEVDDRSNDGHGDNSKDEVFNLKFLFRNSCRPEGLD
jgi:hypothetical protein